MLRGRRRGAFVLAALSLLTWLLAAPASAVENPHFTRFWVEATGAEGKIDVEIDMEYDFDGVESHGVPVLPLTRKQIEAIRTTTGVRDHRRPRRERHRAGGLRRKPRRTAWGSTSAIRTSVTSPGCTVPVLLHDRGRGHLRGRR